MSGDLISLQKKYAKAWDIRCPCLSSSSKILLACSSQGPRMSQSAAYVAFPFMKNGLSLYADSE
jgi:hypothetical protein